MLKWCLSLAAVVGLYSMLPAQVPGGGSTSLACGQSKSYYLPGGYTTGSGATAAEACANAIQLMGEGLATFALTRCARCEGGPPHCGGASGDGFPWPPTCGTPTFDPFLGIWSCPATLPAGSILVTCNQCPD